MINLARHDNCTVAEFIAESVPLATACALVHRIRRTGLVETGVEVLASYVMRNSRVRGKATGTCSSDAAYPRGTDRTHGEHVHPP